jgi:hypothetical protein
MVQGTFKKILKTINSSHFEGKKKKVLKLPCKNCEGFWHTYISNFLLLKKK